MLEEGKTNNHPNDNRFSISQNTVGLVSLSHPYHHQLINPIPKNVIIVTNKPYDERIRQLKK